MLETVGRLGFRVWVNSPGMPRGPRRQHDSKSVFA